MAAKKDIIKYDTILQNAHMQTKSVHMKISEAMIILFNSYRNMYDIASSVSSTDKDKDAKLEELKRAADDVIDMMNNLDCKFNDIQHINLEVMGDLALVIKSIHNDSDFENSAGVVSNNPVR